MAMNPYTLYNLYNKGILEYVPSELLMMSPMGAMMPMNNPYLEMAQQGGLYQNYGAADSFELGNGVQSPYANQVGNPVPSHVEIGSLSNAGGMNTFNGYGVGAQSGASTPGIFGFNNVIGANTQAGGMNTFNGNGIGANTQAGGMNAFGGFAEAQNNIAGGYYKTMSVFNRVPKLLLGLGAAAIGIIGLKKGFKGLKFWGKKSQTQTSGTGFWSKLNPKNWRG